jgi:Tol biopolymer transport system component/DNA-binding winged helix-turn-helix (wHTH) protein
VETSKKPGVVHSFGSFELFPNSYELRKYGIPVRIAPQPLRVLMLLVERAGEIVTRDQLRELTWGQEVVVDFEVGLNRCIGRLRTALSDNADKPLYLQTVPKVGYRFIAPVRTTVATGVQPAKSQSATSGFDSLAISAQATIAKEIDPTVMQPILLEAAPVALSKPNRLLLGGLWKLASLGLLAILLLCVALYVRRQPNQGVLESAFTPSPLAIEVGNASSPSFSPGGERIAFSWNGIKQDNFDIYVKMVDSSALVRLTQDAAVDSSPVWSPDGRSIAFCRSKADGSFAIWITSPLGGPERKVLELNEPIAIAYDALTFTPDSQSLIYSDNLTKDRAGILFVINLRTGAKRQLTFPPPGSMDNLPSIAPDGHAVAFTRDLGRGVRSIFILPLDRQWSPAGPPAKLTWAGFEAVSCSHPKWTPDSKEVVFISNRTAEHQLWVTHHGTKKMPQLVGSLGANIDSFAISSEGGLAFVRVNQSVNIWRLDLRALIKGLPASPVRVVESRRFQANPSLSPDGTKLAFESNSAGPMEIWTANADGSEAAPLTAVGNPITGSASWSHDGSRIAFDSRATGLPAIYVMPSAGGTPVRLTAESSRDVVPSWSSDDRWIFFTSDRSGTSQIWKIRPSGGAAEQVTRDGGFAALASPDGKFLYYTPDRRLGPLNLARWSACISLIGHLREESLCLPMDDSSFIARWMMAAVICCTSKNSGIESIDPCRPDHRPIFFTGVFGDVYSPREVPPRRKRWQSSTAQVRSSEH